jgi:regulator of sigma E protease
MLVFVHEMGHYLVARLNGVRVEVFSIGFGPELFGWTDKAKTRWKFSLIPLGGYVKMFGDADAASRPDSELSNLTEEERAEAFPYKRLGQRSWIVAAGPIANFLFAVVLLAGLFIAIGQPFTPPVVGTVIPDSAAEQAGLRPGDRIVRIDDTDINSFQDIQWIVSLGMGEEIGIVVLRDGAEIPLLAQPILTETTDDFGNRQQIGRLGISHSGVEFVRHGPFKAVWSATEKTGSQTLAILKAVGQMFVGDRSAAELGGPLRIAKMSGQVAEYGLASVVQFMWLLSISLGLINLFPIPILDGGHLLFYAIEAVRGRPLGDRAQEYGFRIGLALVLSLMVFATWNDIVHHVKVFEFIKDLVT